MIEIRLKRDLLLEMYKKKSRRTKNAALPKGTSTGQNAGFVLRCEHPTSNKDLLRK